MSKSQVLHLVKTEDECATQQDLYSHACGDIQNALRHGRFFEALALSENVISHGLAARKAFIKYGDATRSQDSGIGALVFELAGIKQNGVRESDSDALALYLQIMGWCEDKNALLHALLNVDETGRNWEARLGDLKCAAVSGSALAEQFVFLSAQLNLKQSKLPS